MRLTRYDAPIVGIAQQREVVRAGIVSACLGHRRSLFADVFAATIAAPEVSLRHSRHAQSAAIVRCDWSPTSPAADTIVHLIQVIIATLKCVEMQK